MEIHLVRTSTGLRPYTDDDYEEMIKIKVGSIVKANFNQGRLDFYNENPDRRRDAAQRNVVSAAQRQGEENRQSRGASIA